MSELGEKVNCEKSDSGDPGHHPEHPQEHSGDEEHFTSDMDSDFVTEILEKTCQEIKTPDKVLEQKKQRIFLLETQLKRKTEQLKDCQQELARLSRTNIPFKKRKMSCSNDVSKDRLQHLEQELVESQKKVLDLEEQAQGYMKKLEEKDDKIKKLKKQLQVEISVKENFMSNLNHQEKEIKVLEKRLKNKNLGHSLRITKNKENEDIDEIPTIDDSKEGTSEDPTSKKKTSKKKSSVVKRNKKRKPVKLIKDRPLYTPKSNCLRQFNFAMVRKKNTTKYVF